jgi:predicted nucleic acid-binding protein
VIVFDCSGMVHALTIPDSPFLAVVSGADSVHAPQLLDYEVASSLRGLLLGKKIDETTAHAARGDFAALPITRYPMAGMEERVWELRSNFNPYDASYITLAEALECPLYTYDLKLVAPRIHDADVRVLGRTG